MPDGIALNAALCDKAAFGFIRNRNSFIPLLDHCLLVPLLSISLLSALKLIEPTSGIRVTWS